MNAELALQLLFSPKPTVFHLCFLPALSANIAVCIFYCMLTVWDIFNQVVSISHSPYFGFDLFQVLPFIFKCAAIKREVGKPRTICLLAAQGASLLASCVLELSWSAGLCSSAWGCWQGQHSPSVSTDPCVCCQAYLRSYW